MSLKYLNRRAIYTISSVGLLVAMAVPAFLPAFASAAEITDRSIALSSSVAGATNVTYDVTFTVSSAGAGAYIIDFCDNSPLPGDSCTAPTGFSAAGVATSTASTTVAPLTGDTTVEVTQTVAGSGTANVVLTGLTNPSSPTNATADNGFYARIITYDNATDANAYTAENLGSGATDSGGVALAITSAIGISASVQESMTFCVADATITASCANASSNLPDLTLGVTNGDTTALEASTLSTGTLYTQLSTNAASGAVVNLTSSTTSCGGLELNGNAGCNIGPAPSGGFTAGTADFGVKTGSVTATSGYAYATGTLIPEGSYNSSNYFMHYVAGNASGVTSTYGDPFISSNGAPVNNENMPLTFGASINNNTPAGNYSATLGLIASATF